MGSETDKIFADVPSFVSFPKQEEEMLAYWKENDTFGKLRSKNIGNDKFIFLEGPPTANGLPHIGHSAGRAIKDVFLRYHAMKGFHVFPWKGGWDCHGLPVEIGVEKELGLKSKKDVVEFGIAEFNNLCRKSVMRYEGKWKEMSERLGFWIDMEDPYVTMTNDYVESVWWSLKTIYDKGLLEKGHYIIPYCPRCGTPLSSHEVAQGYKEVKELSVTLKFKLAEYDEAKLGQNAFVLAWTTTPWTLPGNVALAIGKDIDYAIVEQNGEKLILAMDLIESVIEGEHELLGVMKGSELVGWKYHPLFDFMDLREEGKTAYEVVAADFVTTEEGTGVVHTAVMYGEDDYNLGMKIGLPARHTVDMEGKFNELVSLWQGQFVKKQGLDVEIAIHLYDNNRLYKKGNYAHTYPYCWRCDSPLLYYGLDSWFVRMSRLRDRMMANNEEIEWKPEHLKYGRFGNFLEELKDWALSRNRFWGTPLPIWQCGCGKELCVGSFEELGKLAGKLPDDFEPHRPWVDNLNIPCPDCGKAMTREEYVIDTWYDSGSAPFAQFHYPFENKEQFEQSFPADFITEAIDQTRGWFYTLLAVNTAVFDKTPYLKCLTQGLLLNEDGQKMSKSKGTAIDAHETFDKSGADATRIALMSVPCWTSQKFSDASLKEAHSKVMNTLWNVYSFYVSNANLDGFDPSNLSRPEHMLDRWILSRLQTTNQAIQQGIDKMELHKSVRAVFDFIDDLSNWYVRRSRRRFWTENVDEDKNSAYSSLYRVLVDTARMMAPFTPFLSDSIYQNLVTGIDDNAEASVHLSSYPEVDESLIDTELEAMMAVARKAAEAGRNARQTSGSKLRQPLSKAVIVLEKGTMDENLAPLLKEELNVKEIVFSDTAPKFSNQAIAEGQSFKVYIDMTLTPELASEGIARDVVRRIQSFRKDEDLQYDQRIRIGFDGDDEMVNAIQDNMPYISREVLADEMARGELPDSSFKEWKIDGRELKVWLVKIKA